MPVSCDNARLLNQIKMDDGTTTLMQAMQEYRHHEAAFKNDDSAVQFMKRFHDPIARFSRILGVHWSEGFGIALAAVKH